MALRHRHRAAASLTAWHDATGGTSPTSPRTCTSGTCRRSPLRWPSTAALRVPSAVVSRRALGELASAAALAGAPADVRRFWLHQANKNMNDYIAKKVLGRAPEVDEAPIVLDEFANTSSAGCVIAFHRHRRDLNVGDFGVLCSFGAGYSAGSVIVRRAA